MANTNNHPRASQNIMEEKELPSTINSVLPSPSITPGTQTPQTQPQPRHQTHPQALPSLPPTPSRPFVPRLIIHGGAGNITPANLPAASRPKYRQFLHQLLLSARDLLAAGADALNVASHAVAAMEDNPLFNAGRGAVFNRAGGIELEASVMVSGGLRKRGCAVSLLRHVKNPVLLAREMLVRGDGDLETGRGGLTMVVPEDGGENGDGDDEGSAQGHVHLSGDDAERLARCWGLAMREERYFWTKERWEEHRRGLRRDRNADRGGAEGEGGEDESATVEKGWDGTEYLPQGTVGCVVLDQKGTLAVATSTGGLTNKLPGRIGDTPTFGAGFWTEEWPCEIPGLSQTSTNLHPKTSPSKTAKRNPCAFLTNCFCDCGDSFVEEEGHIELPFSGAPPPQLSSGKTTHKVALSGTGNGDTFLRLCASRTAAARTRFLNESTSSPVDVGSRSHPFTSKTNPIPTTLASSLTWMAGPSGQLQQSAGTRFGRTGEGEGGIIGLEISPSGESKVAFDFNCGGMFRAYFDDVGRAWFGIFRDDDEYYDERRDDAGTIR